MREKRTSHSGTVRLQSDQSEEKTSFLAQVAIFQHFSVQDLNAIEQSLTSLPCSPGRMLYRPGDVINTLFFVKSGHIQLYHLSTDGRKLITNTLEAGACFGEQALCSPNTATSFAEAVDAAALYLLNKVDLDHLLLLHSAVSGALLQLMGQRLTGLENQLVNTTFKSVTARLADLLLQLATEQEREVNGLVVNGFSHEELADRLGVYRETVSTALRELKDARAIQLGRKHIVIHQPDLLAQLAQTNSKSGLHRREH
ncbi:transcriptional regulator FNR [Dictyobacter sp. S3.2.2.5]|uniref:Transcriptional regulator FNR n=1 Tax=Dictyobacter halimunensis TaxID=3026934 RepID=A0ABQ6FWY0_9CHLR|nr:transcriptional regulator FNR [Dictyobacter sp. S3.2.2.5]